MNPNHNPNIINTNPNTYINPNININPNITRSTSPNIKFNYPITYHPNTISQSSQHLLILNKHNHNHNHKTNNNIKNIKTNNPFIINTHHQSPPTTTT